MMTKSDASTPVQANLFKVLLRDIVYPQHELILLRDAIDWGRFEKVLEPPTDQSIMSRWRSRVGETGVMEMLKESVAAAVRSKVAKRRDFEKVNIDTTVQEKNVRFPTDARTLDRARERVVGEKPGIRFRRTYVRKGKTMLLKHSGYVMAALDGVPGALYAYQAEQKGGGHGERRGAVRREGVSSSRGVSKVVQAR